MILSTFDQVLVVLGLGQSASIAAYLAVENWFVYIAKSDLI